MLALAGLSMIRFGVAAQTPESLVKACSNIPSAETLKHYCLSNYESAEYQKAVKEVDAFRQRLEENSQIIKNKVEEIEKAGNAAAEKEQDKLKAQVEKDLLGGKSVEQMQKQTENMSQAELMQMGMQMMSQMQKNSNPQDMYKIATLSQELLQIQEKIVAESERMNNERAALKAKHRALWQKGGKYYTQFLPLQNELDKIPDGEVGDIYDAQLKRLSADMNRIKAAYYSEIIPEWLKLIEKQRTDNKKVRALMEQQIKLSLESSALAGKMQGISLDATAEVAAATEQKKHPWENAESELSIISSSLSFVRAEIIK